MRSWVAIAGASCSLGAFLAPTLPTRYLLIGDATWDVLDKIVAMMGANSRNESLYWDLYNIPQHCRYVAPGAYKGAERTVPAPNVQWLLDQCQTGGVTVASSNPIPAGDTNVRLIDRRRPLTEKRFATMRTTSSKLRRSIPSSRSLSRLKGRLGTAALSCVTWDCWGRLI